MRRAVALIAALLLGGCQGGASPAATGTAGPPAAYAAGVCAAMAEVGGGLRQALIVYQTAVGNRNGRLLADSVGQIKAATDLVRSDLVGLPSWPPGDALTADLTQVAAHLGSMVELLRVALTSGNTARADQATAEFTAGFQAMTAVPADAQGAIAAGLHC